MSFFDDVEGEIRGFSVGRVSVRDFRLSLAETTSSSLGIESNRVGSPYAPLTVCELGGGGFVLQWSDGRISRGALTRASPEGIRESLASAFEGRYEDPEDANFPEAADVPQVELYSPAAAAIADGTDADALPAILSELAGTKEGAGAKLVDVSAGAAKLRKRVVSSGGFRAECEMTEVGFSLSLDSLVWDGHGSRAPFSPEVVTELAARTVADYAALSVDSEETPRGPWTVLLHPRVAESFLRQFLFGNLSGSAVANGRSRYSADDFRAGRRVLREDLSLSTRPLEPLGSGSFRFTDDGIVSRPVSFIEGGSLRTPVLGLKSARKLAMDPAPAPTAIEGFELSAGERLPLASALAGHRLLVVHSVLGMHTQDAIRGDYSLLCPQAVLYEDGIAAGRVKTTLNGSFFDDLSSAGLRLVEFPGFALPGLRMAIEVS